MQNNQQQNPKGKPYDYWQQPNRKICDLLYVLDQGYYKDNAERERLEKELIVARKSSIQKS